MSTEPLDYTKAGTTYSKPVVTDPSRTVSVEIGDSKQADFYPQFKTLHWDNECNFSVRLMDADYPSGVVAENGSTLEWSRGNRTARFYPKPTDDEHGGFEFEVELATPPASNILSYTIQTKGFTFHFQPPLNKGPQKESWVTVTETEAFDAKGRQLAYRPPNVVGSYAVYHATCSNNVVGGKAYLTGKAFHLYRPFATDAKGTQVWCDLEIDADAGMLTIIIPQAFLDSAVYPVIIDPTFGYTTIGGSADTWDSSALNWIKSTSNPASSGTLTKLSIYGKISSGSPIFQPALYSDNGSAHPDANLASSESGTAFGASNGWIDSTLSYASITSGVLYWLGYKTNTGILSIQYDSASGGNFRVLTGPSSWPATAPGPGGADSEQVSIYGTYTTAGGSRGLFQQTPMNGLGVGGSYFSNPISRHRQPQQREWVRHNRIFVPRHVYEGRILDKVA